MRKGSNSLFRAERSVQNRLALWKARGSLFIKTIVKRKLGKRENVLIIRVPETDSEYVFYKMINRIDYAAVACFYTARENEVSADHLHYPVLFTFTENACLFRKLGMTYVDTLTRGFVFGNYKKAIEENLPKDSVRTVRVEVGIFAAGDNAWVDSKVFGQGDGGRLRHGFVTVDTVGEVIEAPETYKDVKGLVTADYQKHLEEKWVKSLRKKYKVKIDKDVLKTVNNH